MIRELFLSDFSLSSYVWQSTIFLVVGLVGSFILRHRSSRAHQVLFLAMITAVIVPIMSILVKHYELGVFVAEPVVMQSQAEDRAIASNYGAPGIISAENIEHKPGLVEKDLPSAMAASEIAKFPWRSVMLCGWIAASLILAARLLATFVLGVRLLGRALPLNCEKIKEAAHLAGTKLGIDKDVKVYSSQSVRSPVIWCWRRRPVLLVPSAAGRFDNGVDWAGVLCHELAHWKRRDHISGLFAELVVCILPWHPLLWWAKSRLVRLSEQACDDWVVATGQPCTDYAESLLDLTPGGQMAFVPAVVSSKRGLAYRIRRILKDSCGNPRAGLAWALVVSIVTVLLAAGVAFAQSRPAEMKETETGGVRIVHFPKDRSLGELYVRDRDFPKDTIFASVDWEWLGNAQGDITVPAGKAVRLNISKEAWQNGKPFAGLKPDDIQMLSFSRYKDADDSVLEDISSLTDLQVLRLSGTQILGTGLKHLGKLKKLKWLSLAVTHVGDEELAALAGLNSLEYLNLNYAPVGNEGMIHVGKIKILKSLVLSGTSVDDDGLEHLKDLTSLQQLRFFNNYITDEGLKNLAGLTELEELILSRTQVSGAGLVHLGKLKKLKNLRLGNTKVGDEGLKHLKELESLEYLELPSDTHITDEGLAQLSELHSLKHLYIISDSITEKGLESLSKLKSLEKLDTGGENINNACMAKLTKFPSLKTLWIQHCPVTDAGLAELKNMQSLTTLEIGNCPITGEGLAILKEYPSLVGLELERLNLGKAGLSGIAELTSLESLKIYYTKISDDDLASLSNLINLKILYVDSKKISDAGMQHLAKLKSLESLVLRGSEITDDGLVHLEEHGSLTYLALPGTKVTEEGMAKLKKKIPALEHHL